HEVAPELLPLPVADTAERPRPLAEPPVVLRVEDAVARPVVRVDVDVLRMHVEDRAGVPELTDREQRVDPLPDEVRRVEVDADLRAGRLPQSQGGLRVV